MGIHGRATGVNVGVAVCAFVAVGVCRDVVTPPVLATTVVVDSVEFGFVAVGVGVSLGGTRVGTGACVGVARKVVCGKGTVRGACVGVGGLGVVARESVGVVSGAIFDTSAFVRRKGRAMKLAKPKQ